MSRFEDSKPAEPAGKRERWTATATWQTYSSTSKQWHTEATARDALSRHELNIVAQHLTDLYGACECYELMLQHHPIDRPARRITDAIMTRPEDAPDRILALRAALTNRGK